MSRRWYEQQQKEEAMSNRQCPSCGGLYHNPCTYGVKKEMSSSSAASNSDEVLEKIEKAYQMVTALCRPRGSKGARNWTMSIPARPDYDPDLIINDALASAEKFIKGTQNES